MMCDVVCRFYTKQMVKPFDAAVMSVLRMGARVFESLGKRWFPPPLDSEHRLLAFLGPGTAPTDRTCSVAVATR